MYFNHLFLVKIICKTSKHDESVCHYKLKHSLILTEFCQSWCSAIAPSISEV